MVNSMTGFASKSGQNDNFSWILEIKSVNARGLDVRVRVYDGGNDVEQFLKSEISKSVHRGTINVLLKTDVTNDAISPSLNAEVLKSALAAISKIEDTAKIANVNIGQSTATDLMKIPGIYEAKKNTDRSDAILADLKKHLPDAVDQFVASRANEGDALGKTIAAKLVQVDALVEKAMEIANSQKDDVAKKLKSDLESLLISDAVDEGRLEHELAIMAVKSDITEEIDRLRTHVDSANQMLLLKGAVGRKLDFLMQEFNREANTLCSKSGSKELTRIGLDLKTVIDQMREQVQNVE